MKPARSSAIALSRFPITTPSPRPCKERSHDSGYDVEVCFAVCALPLSPGGRGSRSERSERGRERAIFLRLENTPLPVRVPLSLPREPPFPSRGEDKRVRGAVLHSFLRQRFSMTPLWTIDAMAAAMRADQWGALPPDTNCIF